MDVDPDRMQKVSEEATALLRALSHPKRLLMLCRMTEGEASVGALAELLSSTDAVASQHLAILRRERLVRQRRDGQTIFYSLASEEARAVLQTLYALYCAPAARPARRRAA